VPAVSFFVFWERKGRERREPACACYPGGPSARESGAGVGLGVPCGRVARGAQARETESKSSTLPSRSRPLTLSSPPRSFSSDKVVVASAGFQADGKTLAKVLRSRHVTYVHDHRRPMPVAAAAQLLGNTLYYKRFFPYYAFTLCAGLDPQGRGAVYAYDAVGSHERVPYGCQGSGKDLVQPVLDNQLASPSPLALPAQAWEATSMPVAQCVDLVKAAFVAAGERDIFTGDAVEILIITKDGVREETLALKKD
jgi:20S proteasome subunit beta 6